MAANARYSLPPGYDGKNGGTGRPGAAALPHIEDLLAIPKDIDPNQSIKRLLEIAEASLRQSEMSRDFNRPALALKEYIRASIVAVQIISNHKDYPALRNAQGNSGRAHNALLKRISLQSDVYEKIKRDIIEDNKKTGVQPTARWPESSAETMTNGHPARPQSSSSADAAPSSSKTQPAANGHTSPPVNGSAGKAKPTVHPKPQSLHGNALRHDHGRANNATLDLAARFANLRGPQASPGQDPRIKTYAIPTEKPSGPRDMPGLQRLNINTDLAASALPKIPDAIYSPARGSVSGEAARLPTSAPRGLFTRTGSSTPMAGTPSISQQQSNEYFPPVQTSTVPKETEHQVKVPEGDSATAEQLYEAMKGKGSILLIDIRSRDEFDQGHIMSSSIICIEPSILLRDNISSEEISESMVLSPHQELSLFEKRDKYDLVVFYDQSSERITESPKNSDQLVVVSLHRALVHLNYGRDLKNSPKILRGGLDAWVDLMGPSALQSTAATSSNPVRAKRRHGVIQRRGSKYIVTTLQPADVKVWQSTLERDAQQTATRPSFPRTGEEFLRSPPVPTKQQSMTSSMASSVATDERHKHALAHKFASPTQLPAPPARPRAAVQRPSHSGLSQADDANESYSESNASMQRTLGRSRKGTEQPPGGVAKIFTGLNNPRNWCYANSTLQSLLASPEFGRELADSEWMIKYKVPRKNDEKIDPPQLMIRIISNLFHWMSTGKFETMKAQTLMEYSRHLCKSSDPSSQFGGAEQQDAQEFMSFVTEQLHDETNPRRDQTGSVKQPSTKDRPLIQAAMEYWRNHAELNQSIIDRYWRGIDLSTVQCMHCNTSTHTFSPFTWFPVSVGPGRDMPLSEALRQDAAGSILEDFACDHCKGRQEAMQSTSFARMPPLLCIGFRRFKFDKDRGVVSKSNAAISWDFNDFDFSPYCLNSSERYPDMTEDKAFSGPFRYECYAVIMHKGHSINTGHYYAYVRDSSTHDPYAWYRCSDAKITKVRIGSGDGEDIQKDVFSLDTDQVPYLVFFRRKGG
ncbi:Ubiquitin carboxyl-terminal hydrolase 5 [Tolypocladium capitatum]|uniref:Ubiquitin carboxyl-terminal hydrolase 5 n=1 Tax=Tolypocladium capitatum TaxID=45235 RepID=A0A2K3QMC7_9HYPO|nr:Ubiquitin carboxyl-terminal hydrolase 5 [Tolypocladium capitatum]